MEEKKQGSGAAVVLKKYFGYRPDYAAENKLGQFMDEYKKLTPEAALELAKLAAREMGLSQDQVSFPLE